MNKIISILVLVGFSLTFINSCSSGDGTQNPKDALSAFINENDHIIAFGHVNLEDILSKSDYATIPTFGGIIDGQKKDWEKVIDFSQPVYYALEGPLDENGEPESFYGFIQLKDKQAMIDKMTVDGFDFNEVKGISYTEDGPMMFGVLNNVGVIIVKKQAVDVEKIIASTFQKVKGKTSGGEIDEILEKKGDLVLGMNVSSIFTTSQIDFSDLSKDKQNELQELVEGSYIQTVFKFEEGAAIVETKNLFSSKLKEKLFFTADDQAPIVAFLGSGSPRMGFSINIDMKKMNDFITEFSPEAVSDIAKAIGPQAQMALMFRGKDGLASFLNGKVGGVLYGDLNPNKQADFNAFLGLTTKGKDLVGDFSLEDAKFDFGQMLLEKDGLVFSNNEEISYKSNQNELILPEGCENFGKGAISFFVNLDGVDMDALKLEDEANILRAVKYITFDYDNNGGVLYIKAKKGQENILKQAMDIFVEEFSEDLKSMQIQ